MIRVAIQSDAARLAAYTEHPIRAAGNIAVVRCVGTEGPTGLPAVDAFDELLAADAEAVVVDVAAEETLKDIATTGKPALVDLAMITSSCISRIKDHSGQILVGQALRFEPANVAVQQAVRSGRLGELGLVRLHAWNSAAGCRPQLAHLVDLVCWLFDQTPLSVYAVGDHTESGDFTQLHLGFSNRGMALIDRSHQLPGGRYMMLSAIGSDGAAYADEHHNQQLLFNGEQPGISATRPMVSCSARQLAAFLGHVDRQSETFYFPTAEDAERALKVLAAIEKSRHSHAAVSLQAGV